jgi:hypothetical protein
MAHKCENCGASNTNEAQRCTHCNFPFNYFTWYCEYGFVAFLRAGAVAGVVIAATTFPVIIGTIIVISRSLGIQWLALAAATSIIDAIVLLKLKNRLMRIGWMGPYRRTDWWRQWHGP